jgi:hypothetical protein
MRVVVDTNVFVSAALKEKIAAGEAAATAIPAAKAGPLAHLSGRAAHA